MKTKFYMKEFIHFDGENFVTFNVLDIDNNKNEIVVVVSKDGRIFTTTYRLLTDENGLYFEYGPCNEKIKLNDFEEVE